MANNLQVFRNDQFGEIRTIMKDGEPWFVAVDVCKALEHSNVTMAMERLDDDEKAKLNLGLSGGDTNCVNEPGLYSLVIGSRKPEAKAFKRWITHDVIPTIRKHGAYMTPETIEKTLLNPDYIIQLATTLKGEMEKRKQLEAKVEKDKPLVQFAEHVGSTSDCLSIRQFSKIVRDESIKIGEKRLFQWLRDKKYLDARNVAYQRYIESGYFNVREVTKNTVVGAKIFPQTLVTGKGQIYLLSKLREEFC